MLQPTYAGRRKFGNRIVGTAGLRAHHRNGIARSARGGLFALQHHNGRTSAGKLASDARTGDASANNDNGWRGPVHQGVNYLQRPSKISREVGISSVSLTATVARSITTLRIALSGVRPMQLISISLILQSRPSIFRPVTK